MRIQEILPPDQLTEALEKRIKELQSAYDKVHQSLARTASLDYHIKFVKHGRGTQVQLKKGRSHGTDSLVKPDLMKADSPDRQSAGSAQYDQAQLTTSTASRQSAEPAYHQQANSLSSNHDQSYPAQQQPASNTKQPASFRLQPASNTIQPASNTPQPASNTIQPAQDQKIKYLRTRELHLAKQIAQKDYNVRLEHILRNQIKILLQTQKKYATGQLQKLTGNMCNERKKLITAVTLTDAQYKDQWLAQSYEKKDFVPDKPEYISTTGIRVRSKSELLIVEALTKESVPFKYESPLILKNGRIIHPDFCCLNIKKRQELYWEHFGMMDNPEYAQKAVARLQALEESGFILGINLIITMETLLTPLSIHNVKKMIRQFFS